MLALNYEEKGDFFNCVNPFINHSLERDIFWA